MEIHQYNKNDSTYTIAVADNNIVATVTASGNVAARWIHTILLTNRSHRRSNIFVGLDLKRCPHGTRGKNPIALLQLCVGRRCLIFQLLFCDFVPDNLCQFLKNNRFQFVGFDIKRDARELKREYRIEVQNPMDVQEQQDLVAVSQKLRQRVLNNLIREVIGSEMEKPRKAEHTNWERRNLTNKQIGYAAVDAFVSLEVGRRLNVGDY